MDKSINKLFIFMSILSLFIYPFSTYGSVLVGAIALILSILLIKEKELTSKVLQPFILLCFIVIIKSVFTLILYMIQRFAYIGEANYKLINNISDALYFIDAMLYIFVLIFIVVSIICFFKNLDIPFVSNLSNKILGIENSQSSENKPKKHKKPTTIIIDGTNKKKDNAVEIEVQNTKDSTDETNN